MDVNINKSYLNIEGRAVPFVELEVIGDRHTLSVRRYPKNISVQMWKNSDKRDTKITMKMPHNKFFFFLCLSEMVGNFDTTLDTHTLLSLEERWDNAVNSSNF